MDLEHLENLRSSELSLVLNEINQEKKAIFKFLKLEQDQAGRQKNFLNPDFQ